MIDITKKITWDRVSVGDFVYWSHIEQIIMKTEKFIEQDDDDKTFERNAVSRLGYCYTVGSFEEVVPVHSSFFVEVE